MIIRIMFQFLQKVDKTDLENFVSRQRFDTNIGRIDDALKELIDQVKTSVSLSFFYFISFVIFVDDLVLNSFLQRLRFNFW